MITDVEEWTQHLSAADLPPMLARDAVTEDFRARVVTGRLGAVRLAELATPGGECFRDEEGVREADQGLCQIYLTRRGRTRLQQAGRVAELGAGDLAVVDPAAPLEVVTTDTRYLTLLVPRHLLGLDSEDLSRLSGHRIDGSAGSGALLTALVRTAVRSIGTFAEEEANRSGTALTELVSALLSSRLPRLSPDEALRGRIRAYIKANLSAPGLDPRSVAAAHHISVRRLHQLFRPEPLTVAALIRHNRLERCRTDLTGCRHLSVAAVAARWGFTDGAHFSRLFRATYGCTPTEHRQNPPTMH
ncbi:AraC family transcriptional regulator [Kineosporia sp. NBRC 101677]|uniref:helix-turn-helix domain-containing protein n=1 Tax=Kineosporia sp. NBRC 101677 TaxID=3032197 RepID=UPI0024A0834E|nr:helix-turn-helix domain-containing protein [Kineosporia sp. NBRC 101677]GLY19476.1 AraC family transcriptional regulator [Kineosporia sp. NBRC 101677]